MRATILLAILTLPLLSEERWSTPILGAVFEEASKSLRPVAGVAGAAALADAVAIPVKADKVFPAPGERWAVVSGPDGTGLLSWDGAEPVYTGLDGAIRPASVAWSGRRFALHDGDGKVQVWDGASLRKSHTLDAGGGPLCLRADDSVVPGACDGPAVHRLTDSGVVRDGETLIPGDFRVLAASAGWVATAGAELVLRSDAGELTRFDLRAVAVSLAPLRSPGVFALELEDGSLWVCGGGELQALDGGRR